MFDYDASDSSTADSDGAKSAVAKYSWLYSIYSFPNMILPLFGGFMVDKLGVRVGAFCFSLTLVLGQAMCALSGVLSGHPNFDGENVYILMLLGRFIFALGGENLIVA